MACTILRYRNPSIVRLCIFLLCHELPALVSTCVEAQLSEDELVEEETGFQVLSLLQAKTVNGANHPNQLERLMLSCEQHCVPMVFVVSSGRSGSTTVLHMLNQIPGYDIKGENYNIMEALSDMYKERMSAREAYGPASLYNWRRSSEQNSSAIMCGLQTSVLGMLNPNPSARVSGFKEIRWDFENHLTDLDLLLKMFPCGKAVLNYRKNIEEQKVSYDHAMGDFSDQHPGIAKLELIAFNERYKDRSFLLPLEDLDVDHFNAMLRFLGEGSCKYTDVYHDNSDEGFTRGGFLGWLLGRLPEEAQVLQCS